MKKIKVGIVNYLNTRPMLYGLEHAPVKDQIDFMPDYPANVAGDLIEGRSDIGLVPVAVIPKLKEWSLVGDFCIGCDGPVSSVCLFSETPLEQVKTVLLDYHSRTSTELARILLREHWKKEVEFVHAAPGYRDHIKGNTAGLVIGDECFEQRKISPYIYDLGEAWKKHTGMPFVFAAWVSNKSLDPSFIQDFNEANAYGVNHIPEVIASIGPYDLYDLQTYYARDMSYNLDESKKKALAMFLERISG